MSTKRSCLLASAFAFALAFTGKADIAFTPNSPAPFTTDGPVTVGSVFTPSVNITVTALGFYDDGGTYPVTGALVGIYNSGGTLLESTTVTAGANESNGYAFATVAPLVLSAGQTYTVASNDIPTGYSYNYTSPPGVNPNISFVDSTYTYGVGLNYPTTHYLEVYYGPNFEFNTGVPEPGLYGVLALGLTGLVTAVLRRRRA